MAVESVELASTQCCIAGGGPAGIMAGLLLARAGVDVLVLEKYPDFFRDFRGDTIHPSTLELMYELGYDEELLRLPHQEVRELAFHVGGSEFKVGDFSHLPVHHSFIALMPQWDFLNFLAKKGARYPGFRLRMNAEVTGLVEREGRIAGVRVNTSEGDLEVRADLVLGADGRHSTVRQKAGLEVNEIGAPIDVLWFRLSRPASDPDETMARLGVGNFMVMLNRRHQSCVPGRGGGGEYPGRAAPRAARGARSSARGAGTARMAGESHASGAGAGAESDSAADPERSRCSEAAAVRPTARPNSFSPPFPRLCRRNRRATGTHPDAGIRRQSLEV